MMQRVAVTAVVLTIVTGTIFAYYFLKFDIDINLVAEYVPYVLEVPTQKLQLNLSYVHHMYDPNLLK